MNDLKWATIKGTTRKIQVYKAKMRDKWIDFKDCTTEHKPEELIF